MIARLIPAVAAAALAVVAAAPVRAQIEITPVVSDGGVTAWLYEDHSVPIVTLEASFLGGAALDPEGEEGAAVLMASLLSEGAGDLDATAFATAREDLAAGIGFGAGRDDVTLSATTLAENRETAFDLLRLALTAPRFDPDAVERERGRILASLRRNETDPDGVAWRTFYARAFPNHHYGRPAEGSPESVAGLDADDLRAAHARAFTRDKLRIAVVGAITPEELAPALDRLFGSLPAAGPALPSPAEPVASGDTTVIDFDIPQSVVVFGQPGIARRDPDFITAMVMDHILGGGGFGSRLTDEMREKRGLTYGVFTHLAPGEFGSLYMGSFSTANARAAEAIEIVRNEWRRMAEQGPTEAELTAAKRYMTGEYPLRFDGAAQIAGQLLGLQTAGLGLDYVNERNALVEAVSREDVVRVASTLLDPEALTMVVVGEPEGLAPH